MPRIRLHRIAVQLTAPTLAVLVLALGVSGCHRKADDEASIQKSLDGKGSLKVFEDAANAEYDPPADGEVSEQQMKMYLAVQERAIKIRQVAKKNLETKTRDDEGKDKKKVGFLDAIGAMGDVGDFVGADLRAAQELGYNPAEYQWISGQVAAAQMAVASRAMQQQMAGVSDQVLAMLEAQKEATTDPQAKAALDEQIAQTKASLAEAKAEDDSEPGLKHNVELVEKHQKRIEELQKAQAEAMS